jgi:hypothetical protein
VIVAPIAMFIALSTSIPAMVMLDVPTGTLPSAGKISSTGVIRRDPICTLIGGTRPVPVMPCVVRSLGIPVALDPFVVGARLSRHTVPPRRRRLAKW